jgi:small subunit ribosomal protein S11e
MAEQNEKAFQKQKGVFLNKKKFFVTQGPKKEPRFVRSVGLGFKTPREVSGTNYGKILVESRPVG